MKSVEETEVLVMGAGPVGLFAALRLAERGVQVRVVDKYHRAALHSYALALHPRSLRLLDELGIVEPLIERGQRVERIVVHRGGTQVAEIELSALGGRFPFVLVVPQSVLEGVLEARLEDNGVYVSWGHQVLTFDTDGDAVTALVGRMPDLSDAGLDPEAPVDVPTFRIRASFLIGADGHDSLARRLLGVDVAPVGPPLNYALLEFEALMEQPERMHLVFGDTFADVLWPIGPDRGRWGVQFSDYGQACDAEKIKDLIRVRAPWFRTELAADWFTTARFEPSLAERFGRDNVWLAGDAARMTRPNGVQSMNVGLREAADLVRRMADILHDGGSPKLLQYYNEERSREWKTLLGIKDRLRRQPDVPDWAVGLAGPLVSSLPASGRELNLLLEQIGLRLHWLRNKPSSADA